jgi:hypothetical protein
MRRIVVVVENRLVFSWPERIIGYIMLGYLVYMVVCMILGTYDII